ncbi:hypothetical protein [Pantoea ananatis]|uniref:hypothetical protein n=1 Tax=Pantoea ananas TaxID=553 RepID=UPI000E24CD58|nr:hypothetical protein [Pantoea ananatis]REE79664.1 hypothetical protein C7424_0718 [Pantoea ananatis]
MFVDRSKFLFRFVFFVLSLAGFTFFLFFGSDILPAKLSIDAIKVSQYLDNPLFLDGSFRTTGAFLYSFGEFFAFFITWITGLLFIGIVATVSKNLIGICLALYLIVPCLALNLVWPAKETIVIIMSILVYSLYNTLLVRKNMRFSFVLGVVILYFLYSYFFRMYYFLIIAFYLGICFIHLKLKLNLLLSLMIMVLVFAFLPNEFHAISQGQRDISNAYAQLIGSDNRTAFTNPVSAEGGLNYIYNFFWAMLHLLLPVLFFHSINEFVLLSYNILFVYAIYRSLSYCPYHNKNNIFMSLLFISHYYVQVLFEPDLGSYLRHILSVVIYLLPAFFLIAARKEIQ